MASNDTTPQADMTPHAEAGFNSWYSERTDNIYIDKNEEYCRYRSIWKAACTWQRNENAKRMDNLLIALTKIADHDYCYDEDRAGIAEEALKRDNQLVKD
jgi:hypothetical protein